LLRCHSIALRRHHLRAQKLVAWAGGRLVHGRQRLFESPGVEVTEDEKGPGREKGGIQLERLHLLLDGPVVIAAVEERDGEDVTDDGRGRIELRARSASARASGIVPGRENLRVPLVRRRVSGPELDRALELPLGVFQSYSCSLMAPSEAWASARPSSSSTA